MATRGAAQTDKFLIGSATIMLGPLGTLKTLSEDNSIGLVKDVAMEFTPQFTDLQQGVQNSVVYSVRTGQETRITGASYEFTDRNIAYAAGLNGDVIEAVTGTPYTAISATSGATDETTVITCDLPLIPVTLIQNDWVVVHSSHFSTITRVVDASKTSTGEITVEGAIHTQVVAGAKVTKVNLLELGRNTPVEFVCAKVVGELPNGDVVVLEIPKCQYTSGLSLAFSTSDFSNMALELRPTALVKTDADYIEYQDTLIRAALASDMI